MATLNFRTQLRSRRVVLCRLAFFVGSVVAAGAANAPSELPPIYAELGPEQLIMRGGGWPYLFHGQDGTTVVLGHLHWLPGKPEPLVFTTRSFDHRQSWQEWKPSPGQGVGPVTEGSAVQLDDGRILIFDVYAY